MLKFRQLFESLTLEPEMYVPDYVRKNLDNAVETVFQEMVKNFESVLNEFGFEVVNTDMERSLNDIHGKIIFQYNDRNFMLQIKNCSRIILLECIDMSVEEIKSKIHFDDARYYQKQYKLNVVELGMVWKFSDLKELLNRSVRK
jgi:hypothetical protein